MSDAEQKDRVQKFLSVGEFRELGLLQEVNRLFFHPRGLALACLVDDGDQHDTTFQVQVWDERDDPEGVVFDHSSVREPGFLTKATRTHALFEEHAEARTKLLGQPIQLGDVLRARSMQQDTGVVTKAADPRRTTTDGRPPRPGYENAGAPAPIGPDGQHEAYWVLSEEERRKGFVRPVRTSYTHRGIRPAYPLRDLTEEERARYAECGYVAYEEYPAVLPPKDPRCGKVGRFWTKEQLESGCGAQTTMGLALAETYAREPGFYGATFCCTCGKHLPVAEFVWAGTEEVLGS